MHVNSSNKKTMADHGRSSIWCIEANNLYVWAMMQNRPYKDFKYITSSLNKTLNTPDDSDYGY